MLTIRRMMRPASAQSSTEICFLVGSPRSGTTAAAASLDQHPAIAHFYEPYFLWERYIGETDDDRMMAVDVDARSACQLRCEYARFGCKAGAEVVVDKTPENAFRIPALLQVFPQARFIHLVRDGRDVTASIRREWDKRAAALSRRGWRNMMSLAAALLRRQPFWRNRAQALAFELGSRLRRGRVSLKNKAKWEGNVGWGPRFSGWRQAYADNPRIVFHALQWRRSVEAVEHGLHAVPPERYLTVYYEDLVERPESELQRIHSFLGVAPKRGLASGLKKGRIGAWRTALDAYERELVDSTIADKLVELGYRCD